MRVCVCEGERGSDREKERRNLEGILVDVCMYTLRKHPVQYKQFG